MCDPLFPSVLVKPRSSVRSGAYYAENFIVGPQWRGEGGAPDPRTFSFYITLSGLLAGRDTRSHENFAPDRNDVRPKNRIYISPRFESVHNRGARSKSRLEK